MAGLLTKNRNQHFLPKHQLILAIEARRKQLNKSLWAQLCNMRIIPSYTWTNDFIVSAIKLEPRVDWVSAAVFDNYTEQ
eukprot:4883163-Pleurochrysis_carterae.AAC.1